LVYNRGGQFYGPRATCGSRKHSGKIFKSEISFNYHSNFGTEANLNRNFVSISITFRGYGGYGPLLNFNNLEFDIFDAGGPQCHFSTSVTIAIRIRTLSVH